MNDLIPFKLKICEIIEKINNDSNYSKPEDVYDDNNKYIGCIATNNPQASMNILFTVSDLDYTYIFTYPKAFIDDYDMNKLHFVSSYKNELDD